MCNTVPKYFDVSRYEIQNKQFLDDSIINQLKKINLINRKTKRSHSDEELLDEIVYLNSHMFTFMDVIAMYFICRKIGVMLMEK